MVHQLIANAAYSPEALRVLFEAFDSAWERIEPTCGNDPQGIASVRRELATAILGLAQTRPKPDADELRDTALRVLGHSP